MFKTRNQKGHLLQELHKYFLAYLALGVIKVIKHAVYFQNLLINYVFVQCTLS